MVLAISLPWVKEYVWILTHTTTALLTHGSSSARTGLFPSCLPWSCHGAGSPRLGRHAGVLERAAPLQMLLGAHRGWRFSLSYDFSFMGKWPSAVSFQALEKCLIVFLGAPFIGQKTARRTPPHVSRRRRTGSPRTALRWGRFGISFHRTALAATPQLPMLLFPEAKGRRKMQTFSRKI